MGDPAEAGQGQAKDESVKPRALSDLEADQIRREYFIGRVHQVKRIAERWGVTPATVLAYAKRQHRNVKGPR